MTPLDWFLVNTSAATAAAVASPPDVLQTAATHNTQSTSTQRQRERERKRGGDGGQATHRGGYDAKTIRAAGPHSFSLLLLLGINASRSYHSYVLWWRNVCIIRFAAHTQTHTHIYYVLNVPTYAPHAYVGFLFLHVLTVAAPEPCCSPGCDSTRCSCFGCLCMCANISFPFKPYTLTSRQITLKYFYRRILFPSCAVHL